MTGAGDIASTPAAAPSGPVVDGDSVRFSFPDPGRRLSSVRLLMDLPIPRHRTIFGWAGGSWALRVDRPTQVDRLEYKFELGHADERHESIADPGNPLTARGAFGIKSVIEFDGYRNPGWSAGSSPPGRSRTLAIATRSVRGAVRGRLWSPPGTDPDEPLALLVVHDGPEYDDLAQLTTYLWALSTAARIPRVRAALLAPGPRDDWYSANGAYSRALCLAVLPHLTKTVATTRTIGVGASLGALAMLHAHRSHPGSFDGLFLQSGSFFHRLHDAHERRFSHFNRVERAVDSVLRAPGHRDPVPVVMTCGVIEENIENNRIMARALKAQGYEITLHEVRDAHNYIAWRDTLDPHLTGLLRDDQVRRTA